MSSRSVRSPAMLALYAVRRARHFMRSQAILVWLGLLRPDNLLESSFAAVTDLRRAGPAAKGEFRRMQLPQHVVAVLVKAICIYLARGTALSNSRRLQLELDSLDAASSPARMPA